MRIDHTTDLRITMPDPVSRGKMSFEDYHETLSAKPRTISVSYQNRHLFEITIPPSVFNPVISRSTKALADVVLKEDIPVTGRRFVDLGCGCGIIGLAAAAEKSPASILYTDINPNIDFLKSHPKFRSDTDRVAIQSFCDQEQDNSADIVVFSIPSRLKDQKPADQSVKAAYSRDLQFIPVMLKNISRILAPGGHFVFWYGIHPGQIHFFSEFIILLGHYFDPCSLKCILEYQFEDGYTSTIYSIKKEE